MLMRNAIRTPDGTILESWHVHQYVTHVDAIDGLEYMVDGGLEYIRRSSHGEDLSVHYSDGHQAVREAFKWGTYGKSGRKSLKRVLIKDMDTEHLQALLDGTWSLHKRVRLSFLNELEWRNEE